MSETLDIVLIVIVSILCLLCAGVLVFQIYSSKQKKEIDSSELESHISDKVIAKLFPQMSDNSNANIEALNKQLESVKSDIDRLLNTNKGAISEDLGNIRKELESTKNTIDQKVSQNIQQFSAVSEQFGVLKSKFESFDKLNKEVSSLNSVLTGNKTKGQFGETQLSNVLENFYGETGDLNHRYELQKSLNEPGTTFTPDAAIYLNDTKKVCIDSKFPYDSYRNYIEATEPTIKDNSETAFKRDVKTKIDETAKYINKKETTDYALMFVPFDSIFYLIYDSFYNELVNYATKKRVIIVSPTTILPILYNINSTFEKAKIVNNLSTILESIRKFEIDLSKLDDSIDKYNESFDSLKKNADIITTKIKVITGAAKKAIKCIEDNVKENSNDGLSD